MCRVYMAGHVVHVVCGRVPGGVVHDAPVPSFADPPQTVFVAPPSPRAPDRLRVGVFDIVDGVVDVAGRRGRRSVVNVGNRVKMC